MFNQIILEIYKKILRKIQIGIPSLQLRWSCRLFSGKVRIDSASRSKISIGKHAAIKGVISCSDGGISLGSNFALAVDSEIGAANGGVIVVGERVSIGTRCIISTTGEELKIGKGTSFFSDCVVSGAVSIGEGCLFARNVTIITSTHQIYGDGTIRENDAAFRASGQRNVQPVDIGDDCWLGMNTVVLMGVKLGKGTVVGANAVVTKSFPDYAIIGGVPAKVIGSRLCQ
jgi:carbonic anhydrase/acetyltransferase-like protein (isoleucine patch superfamily)